MIIPNKNSCLAKKVWTYLITFCEFGSSSCLVNAHNNKPNESMWVRVYDSCIQNNDIFVELPIHRYHNILNQTILMYNTFLRKVRALKASGLIFQYDFMVTEWISAVIVRLLLLLLLWLVMPFGTESALVRIVVFLNCVENVRWWCVSVCVCDSLCFICCTYKQHICILI